ncbi:tumor necrosis factor a (TNF superfamily, member 2) [Syngnathoides biaculeatus]|uniref:tumor necrosis factor a (TNF superfamily, member 2) n=1 Tax=Syngnathoides biaculeatus TaxID=300417 RepID=UPI002ADD89B7|nr:tumor necrosis factor a (TNF superfamily, member 2) [Syngnathoides biaculeatus]
MEGDCEVTVVAAVDSESKNSARCGAKHGSNLIVVLLGITLCLAIAAAVLLVFNVHTKMPGQDEDTFDIHHTLRQLSNVRAAIHLTGQYNSQMANSVKWTNKVDPSHSEGGLELKNNEIVIPQDGLYFVYSQVSFRVSCHMDENDDTSAMSMVHLTHRVRRWSSSFGNDEYCTILHSVRTACQKTAGGDADEEGGWYSAVYMGAVFNLNKGDRLKTVTEKMLPNLEEEAGKTFFGVFAL